MTGNYSPSVSNTYRIDQNWHNDASGDDGYELKGYDLKG